MPFYHGTTTEYAEQIRREGLKPVPSNAWRIQWPNGGVLRKQELEKRVYVTERKDKAIDYAVGKVRYLRTYPGQWFDFPVGYDSFPLLKTYDGPQPKYAEPALITLDLPKWIREELEIDPRNIYGGFRYDGSIGPEYITDISTGVQELYEEKIAA